MAEIPARLSTDTDADYISRLLDLAAARPVTRTPFPPITVLREIFSFDEIDTALSTLLNDGHTIVAVVPSWVYHNYCKDYLVLHYKQEM